MITARKYLAVAAGVIVGALSTVAIGLAASDPGEVIFACVDRHGKLEIVDSEHCPHGEKSLSWNRQGPPGPPGEQGPAGPAGPAGPPGAPGESSGTIVSPNGDFVLEVADDGITLQGNGTVLSLSSSGIAIQTDSALTLQATDVQIAGAAAVEIEAGATITLSAPIVDIN